LDGLTVFLPIRANDRVAAIPVCFSRSGVLNAIGRRGMSGPPSWWFTAAAFLFVEISLVPDFGCPRGRVAGMAAPQRAMGGFLMRTMRLASV